ncbi:MAG: hypothetical protein CO099_10420 [Bdellovibrio sp. CG_4_9_14_3_um_filter_39_7]|nr:MAG: hypothetical protein CO099_10420 [Bdellovibrio sp. CG_4_9_14_3_um_filter_39_7]
MNLNESHNDYSRKSRNIAIFTLLTIATSFLWGLYFEYNFLNQQTSNILFGLTLSSLSLWIFGKKFGLNLFIIHLNIFLVFFAIAFISLELGGGVNIATSFLVVIPIICLLILNLKELFIWIAISFIASILLTFLDWHSYQRIWLEQNWYEVYFLAILSIFLIYLIVMNSNYNQRLLTIQEIEEQKANASRNTNLAAIGRIAGGFAQEIKSPITIINGNVSNIKKKLNEEDADYGNKYKSLETVLKTTDRILTITQSLEQLSIGDVETDLSVMRVDQVMKMIESDTQTLRSENIKFIFSNLDIEDSSFYLNETTFFQIILNLISNAKDAIGANSDS